MGRRPRRHPHQRCPEPQALPDPRMTGKAIAWAVIVAVTVWQATAPTLCQPQPGQADAGEGGNGQLPPVPVETWADGSVGGIVLVAFPAPAQGQKRPPCPKGTVERAGGCWKQQATPPPCAYFEVQDGTACYMAVPERPKGAAIAGGSE